MELFLAETLAMLTLGFQSLVGFKINWNKKSPPLLVLEYRFNP
ncbi:hypothetical protein BFG60_3046 [Microcystis aeruginosa NIES-98]|nr:hypothetical protein BFG60_3046 [Microcystis aeruginosa NIES-98]